MLLIWALASFHVIPSCDNVTRFFFRLTGIKRLASIDSRISDRNCSTCCLGTRVVLTSLVVSYDTAMIAYICYFVKPKSKNVAIC